MTLAAMLALVAAAYFWSRVSHSVLFWVAFILTRPLGAVVGDLLDKPVSLGGLALSRYSASAALGVSIVLCVLILRTRQRPGDIESALNNPGTWPELV